MNDGADARARVESGFAGPTYHHCRLIEIATWFDRLTMSGWSGGAYPGGQGHVDSRLRGNDEVCVPPRPPGEGPGVRAVPTPSSNHHRDGSASPLYTFPGGVI